jgi:hypothetical protein
VGDTVQIAGFAQTSPAGFQTIEAQAVQDKTSGKTFTVPQLGAAAPYSGSGRIQQLNYGADGAINGFLLDNGTLATVPPFAASATSSNGGGPKGPPPAEEIKDHLQRVYFRTQQPDYFLQQSQDPRAASFPKWARDFYQLALRAYDRKDMIAADENAKCADELVKALENLAQAATPMNIPPRPPRPPVR